MDEKVSVLRFTQNFNRKLTCDNFTTNRPFKEIYQIGKKFLVLLGPDLDRSVVVGYCIIVDVKAINIHDITESQARIDTGLCKEDARMLIYKLYQNKKNINFSRFLLLTLSKIKKS